MEQTRDPKEVMSAAKKALTKALKEGKPKAASEKTDFLTGLKPDIMALVEKGFSANQIHGILQQSGFLGSYQTVRGVVAAWKKEAGITKPKAETPKAGKAKAEAAEAAASTKKPKAEAAKEQNFGDKQAAYDKKLNIE